MNYLMLAVFGILSFDLRLAKYPTETRPYIVYFETLYKRPLSERISIKFDKLDGRMVGVCIAWRSVKFDYNAWDRFSDDQREELVFHELGHCELLREHNDAKIELNGEIVPESIMYPYLVKEQVYVKNRAYYLKELFKK